MLTHDQILQCKVCASQIPHPTYCKVYAFLKICTVAFESLQAVSERFSNGSSDEAWVVCSVQGKVKGVQLGSCQLKMVHTLCILQLHQGNLWQEPKKIRHMAFAKKICPSSFKVGWSVLILSINFSFQNCNVLECLHLSICTSIVQ